MCVEIRGQLVGVGSPPTMHILGIELRLSGLAAQAFSC